MTQDPPTRSLGGIANRQGRRQGRTRPALVCSMSSQRCPSVQRPASGRCSPTVSSAQLRSCYRQSFCRLELNCSRITQTYRVLFLVAMQGEPSSHSVTDTELDGLCLRARQAHEQHGAVRKALAAHDIAERSTQALMELPSSVSGRWALRPPRELAGSLLDLHISRAIASTVKFKHGHCW